MTLLENTNDKIDSVGECVFLTSDLSQSKPVQSCLGVDGNPLCWASECSGALLWRGAGGKLYDYNNFAMYLHLGITF